MVNLNRTSNATYIFKVYLVVGGWDNHRYLSRSEIMVKGTSVWKEVGGLSYGARGLRAVSVYNTVLVFGRKSNQLK